MMVKVLSAIMIEPAASPRNLNVGASQAFTAVGIYSDGSMADITSQVTWTSSNTNIATILSNGSATGVASGTAMISATLSGITSSSITLNVLTP